MCSPAARSTHRSPSRGICVHDRWNTHLTWSIQINDSLFEEIGYVWWELSARVAALDGHFAADELLAIAMPIGKPKSMP
jgi:hypothetical protein